MALFGLLGGKKTSVGLDIGSGIIELAFQILDPGAGGLQMNVLLVAAKRELVESRTALLGEAGLEASIIDVDAFAIHNAFELNHPDAMQGVVGLVNIGHEVTNVNILEDGVPVLTRDLSVGTRRFREDLQREKGLSAEDSERVIQGQAQSGDLAQRSEEDTSELQSRLHIGCRLLPEKKKILAASSPGSRVTTRPCTGKRPGTMWQASTCSRLGSTPSAGGPTLRFSAGAALSVPARRR